MIRASLMITCLNDTLFPETGRAVVTLLERLGVELEFPREQTCCGQMHFNSGYAPEAMALLRRFAKAFGAAELIVCPSASCTGMVREQYPELAQRLGDRGLAQELSQIVARVYELTELLVDRLGVSDVGARFPHRVTYHPTCHSLRALALGDRPLTLLRAVAGLELVALPGADQCCGFGGTFAVRNADTSIAMLTDKLRSVLDTGAEVVTAADSSCLMQIGGGLRRQRAGVRAMHIAEILACADGAS